MSHQVPHSDGHHYGYVDTKRVPDSEIVLVEQHQPKQFNLPYHHHASVELNFLIDCEMDYSFSGASVRIPQRRLTIFWGAFPHSVASVTGIGKTVNVYVAFSELFAWKLPERFVANLIAGDVMCSAEPDPVDYLVLPRWADEYRCKDPSFQKLLVGEVEMRIRRFAANGWERLNEGTGERCEAKESISKMGTVETMIRYISDNYGSPMSVADVADHVSLSQSYAMTLFRRVTGISIKEHITRTRLSHARMLLSNSDEKIVTIAMDSGFGSLSAFYEAFQTRIQKTPAAFRREARK